MNEIQISAKPMALPQYILPENYTTDDMRALCVKAMRDILTIPWHADKIYQYRNRWDLPDKLFSFEPGVPYAGLPYANAHTGIFQWFYHYDQETGIMSYPGDGQEWGTTLGTVCANCILWAWSLFCNSIGGKFHSFTMSPVYGFQYPGGLVVPQDIDDFRDHSTQLVCEANGEQGVYRSYAAMLAADGLISTPRGHAVMVVDAPTVVYLPDGTIDGENSQVMIQDQRGGQGDGFYHKTSIEGQDLNLSGRVDFMISFKQLLDWSYIPVTTLELQGKKAIDKPWLTFEQGELLQNSIIKTNYLLCTVEAVYMKPDGTRSRAGIRHYTKDDSGFGNGCEGYTYDLEGLNITPGQIGDRLVLEAKIANGDLFVLMNKEVWM